MNDIAVIIVSYNMAKTLKDCIDSLLNQSVQNFRLIIVDDLSSDETEKIIKDFSDKRIDYKKNNEHLGIAASRNKGLSELKNEKIIFFTDADCCPKSNWIEEGLNLFMKDPSVIAVEGLAAYGGEGYHPRLSEKFYHRDFKPGVCKTYNCAYRIEVFRQIGKFDDINFNYFAEDTDFFYRAKKAFPEKKFLVSANMKAIHQISFWTISEFFSDAHRARIFMKLIKKHGRLDFGAGRLGSFILSPKKFILAIFPPLIFIYIWINHIKIRNFYDFLFVLLYILRAYYYRLLVWCYAFKEKIFVI